MFDSHIATLLDVAVALVNELTDGARRGKAYVAPRETDLPDAVLAALPPGSLSREEVGQGPAEFLARTAGQLRDVFAAVDSGDIDAAATTLNTLLRATGARPQLDRVPGEPWQVHFHGTEDSLAIGWSAGCATALALALGSDLAGRLGICRAPKCDRVYVDASRNAAKQFCSPACQSRVKAAAHRARRAAST
ncbi:CGNR zinc finger domain-containing protein [Streptomyces sp. KL118A]|uniref:CGNR zinc finger domain-containing protein n=1 Tax=Streptomyces sp. KL118A TaxID=3045153 RepID=UPI00278BC431|nr:CGNR zinc finger domain-containing protein [Streptomyces sp. KL118A]